MESVLYLVFYLVGVSSINLVLHIEDYNPFFLKAIGEFSHNEK